MTIKIAINGLGRIGRSVIRALYESNRQDIEIVAANGPAAISDHAYLIKYDSVHGTLPFAVTYDEKYLTISDHKIRIFNERDPEKLNWQEVGADIVLECTGKFNKRDLAAKHLESGAKKVLVSAPCDNADSTIVYGINNAALKPEHQVVSIGSCTTNALAPIAKVLNDKIGIENGFMTTIHAYTGDQNLLDASHKDRRRARAAALSMVPTSTGAAKAIGLVLPELAGKLGGTAVRVPVANVSMIDLCFNSSRATSLDEINNLMKSASQAELKNILGFAPDQLVSVDFNHSSFSSVFDPFETSVVGNKLCRVVSWYDNEWGFSNRMLDMSALISKFI